MAKARIGLIRQKVLIEGDINLIEPYEVLVTSDENFDTLLKERSSDGIKTSVVLSMEDYISRLEAAHKEGYDEGYEAGSNTGQ